MMVGRSWAQTSKFSLTQQARFRSTTTRSASEAPRWRWRVGLQCCKAEPVPPPPGSKSVANWQTQFFSRHKQRPNQDLQKKLSLPTVANSVGKLAKSFWQTNSCERTEMGRQTVVRQKDHTRHKEERDIPTERTVLCGAGFGGM